jgi:hypothetical protein
MVGPRFSENPRFSFFYLGCGTRVFIRRVIDHLAGDFDQVSNQRLAHRSYTKFPWETSSSSVPS